MVGTYPRVHLPVFAFGAGAIETDDIRIDRALLTESGFVTLSVSPKNLDNKRYMFGFNLDLSLRIRCWN